ncbi:MAG: flavodoxin family protein [Velocimicrobium sp.]
MKIVMINGQNHKGSTYHIGRMLAEKLTSDDMIDEVYLPKDMPEFCCGCTKCFMESELHCPHYKQIEPITKLMNSADLMIFTTPVYVYHATGSMKALLDHYGYRWMVHRPEEKMFKKQAICISTAAGGGMKSACKDIKDSLFYWGVGRIYSYGVAVRAVSWKSVTEKKRASIEKKMDKIARKIRKTEGKVRPSIKTKAFFNLMRLMQGKGWNAADVTYWKEKGWDKKGRPWKK